MPNGLCAVQYTIRQAHTAYDQLVRMNWSYFNSVMLATHTQEAN